MNVPGLILGMSLPWAAGTALLLGLAGPRRITGGWAVLAGYGFFLGYAILCLLIRSGWLLFGSLSFAWTSGVLALLAVAGLALFARRNRRLGNPVPATQTARVPGIAWQRALGVLLLAWMSLHLLLSALEVAGLPVFPWDALTVWVYRAKAWFLAGGLIEFLPEGAWPRTGPGVAYTVPAAAYPLLPSLIPWWAATALGQWHEALVNVPAWLCGLAVVLGFYGQCRSRGLASLPALGFGYLLVSTPLWGVHMSLAGYADIWLAGYAGLGFVALLHGLEARRPDQLALGFGMLALGLLVKNEGVVWLCAGLAVWLATTLTARTLLGVIVATALLGLALGTLGWTYIELPGLGAAGYRAGQIHVPLAGAYALEMHAVGTAFARNAYVLSNWHLAWVLLPATLLAALVVGRGRPRRAVAWFLLVFAATQMGIFAFSEAGAWAENHTAINRLPLQAYPGLLFAAVLVYLRLAPPGGGLEGDIRAAARTRFPWLALGLFLLVGGLTLAGACWRLSVLHSDRPVERLELDPLQLVPVIGNPRVDDGHLVTDGYVNGIVLLSSGPVRIDASHQSLLRIDLRTDPDLQWPGEAPAFFWRSADRPESVSRITLDGAALVDLSVSEDWQGEITEFGLLFPRHDGRPAELWSLGLESRSLAATLRLLPGEWFEFEPWSQRSVNAMYGGAPGQRLPLSVLLTVAVALTLAVLALWPSGPGRSRRSGLALALLAGWMLLDVRWTANRLGQAKLSRASLAGTPVEQRFDESYLGKYDPWLRHLRDEAIGPEPARVLLIRDPAEFEYYAWRAKYLLLPHAVWVQSKLPRSRLRGRFDFVLFLGEFTATQGPAATKARQRVRLPLSRPWKRRLERVAAGSEGTLYRVTHR